VWGRTSVPETTRMLVQWSMLRLQSAAPDGLLPPGRPAFTYPAEARKIASPLAISFRTLANRVEKPSGNWRQHLRGPGASLEAIVTFIRGAVAVSG
jgi:hypothetical protein